MTYIELGLTDYGVMLYGRVDDDGLMRVTCTADNPDYQAWLNPKAALSTPNVQVKLDKWNYRVICSNHGTYTYGADSRAVTQSL